MSQAIKEIIINTASYYNHTMRPEVLKMYAEDLEDLDPAAVIAAYKAYRRNPKNRTMPLPAQIRDVVCPTVDPEAMARELSGRSVKAIALFGWPQPEQARNYMGEHAWTAIEHSGGWAHFCREHGVSIDPGVFLAQARETIKSRITYGESNIIRAIESHPNTPKRLSLASSLPAEIIHLPKPKSLKPEGPMNDPA